MVKRVWFALLFAGILSVNFTANALPALAVDEVFGPETCQRGTGAPTVFNYSFVSAEPSRGYIFKVYNGGLADATYELVSSSTITLNGTEILGPSNFSQNVSYLEVPVTLQSQNSLAVEVRGKPGGAITLKIFPFAVLDTPAVGQVFKTQPISVSGHLYAAAASVTVNGRTASVSGTAFTVSGVSLSEGRNVITVAAIGDGGFTGTNSVEVVYDSMAPTISIAFPPDGLVTNQNVTPQFAVNDALDANSTVAVSPQPPYGAEGVFQMTVTATDWAGNEVQAVRSFTIDKTAPVIGSTLPTDGALRGEGMPTISASWSDGLSGLDLASARLTLDGTVVSAQVGADGISYQPSVRLPGGLHHVSLSVEDRAGNEALSEWSFSIDSTPPEIAISSPVEGFVTNQEVMLTYVVQDNLDQNPTVTVTPPPPYVAEGSYHVIVAATDQAGNQAQATLDFVIDRTAPVIVVDSPAEGLVTNQEVVPVYTVTDAIDPQPSVALSPAPPYQTEGSYAVMLTATDRAGNRAAVVRNFVIDKTPPVIASAAPTGAYLGEGIPVISAAWSDALSGVELVTARLTLDGAGVPGQVSPAGISYQPPAMLSGGLHHVSLTVKDRACNEALSEWSFSIDSVPPVITISSPAEGFASNQDIHLAYSVEDNLDQNPTVTVTPPPPYSAEGAYHVIIAAIDQAGNRSMVSRYFMIDRTPPVIGSLQPAAGAVLTRIRDEQSLDSGGPPSPGGPPSEATVSIGALFEDSPSGIDLAELALTVNGTNVTSLARVSTFGIEYSILESQLGEHTQVQLTVLDNAGNQTSRTWSFQLIASDTVPPSISIDYPPAGARLNTDVVPVITVADNMDPAPYFTLNPPPPYTSDGTYFVFVTANDRSGNQNTGWLYFTIDKVPPTIGYVTPPNGYVTATSPDVITIWYSGVMPSASRLYVDSVDVTDHTDFGFNYCEFSPGPGEFSIGEHSFKVVLRDDLGNETERSYTFTVAEDTLPPTIQVTYPPNGLVTRLSFRTSRPRYLGNFDGSISAQ